MAVPSFLSASGTISLRRTRRERRSRSFRTLTEHMLWPNSPGFDPASSCLGPSERGEHVDPICRCDGVQAAVCLVLRFINTTPFAARDFWPRRGASDAHTLQGSVRREQRRLGQKESPPEELRRFYETEYLGGLCFRALHHRLHGEAFGHSPFRLLNGVKRPAHQIARRLRARRRLLSFADPKGVEDIFVGNSLQRPGRTVRRFRRRALHH